MPSTNGHGPKRVILYARVSTDEQAKSGYSLPQQTEALREYAAREGYEVLEEVEDPGQSGASLERLGMDKVRDLVTAGGVSVVLAQDRDRFSREPAYTYLLRREFEEHGCKMRALNDRGDDSPEGELMDGVFDQFAKFERGKTTERTRRGRLRRAREGKIIPSSRPNFGFRYNAARDNYVVDQEQMRIVERIFYMVGVEGVSINGVKRVFEREGVPTPGGARFWSNTSVRETITEDVYKPHTYDEVRALVSPEVAARLDLEKCYGIWWYNRRRATMKVTSGVGANGHREYKRQQSIAYKPREEWIAIPVPDAGLPREWVDAARKAIEGNCRISSAGRRFWELSGGILYCGKCGWRMSTHSVSVGKSKKRRYSYYVCSRVMLHGKDACPQKRLRAEDVETQVWEFVSSLLKDPERLRAGLDAMIEQERNGMRGDPEGETRAWLEKLAEADQMRVGYQELAAKSLMTLDELGERLEQLDETRKTAHKELEVLKTRRETVEALERDRDNLLDSYARLVPEKLDDLSTEKRHRIYKRLRLKAVASPGGVLEMSGALGGHTDFSVSETIS
jgi:site-specific DNA recombinase